MHKVNRTYVMGIVCLILSGWILWQANKIPEMLVSHEPGPRLFPIISAIGIAFFTVLSMIKDGPKEAKENTRPYLDKGGMKRLLQIFGVSVLFVLSMQFLGFWITSMAGTFGFVWLLKGDKKINITYAVVICVLLGSICYFGFTRGFNIPLPKGVLWEKLGIAVL